MLAKGDMSLIRLQKLDGNVIVLDAIANERIRDLKARVAANTGADTRRARVAIVLGSDELADHAKVPECPGLQLSIMVSKIACCGQVGPEIPLDGGYGKYTGQGVVAPSGDSYFAPFSAGKVLRVSADGTVDQVGPEIPGGGVYGKYNGAGVVAQSGDNYFAPDYGGRVLRVSADGTVDQVGPAIPGDLNYRGTGVVAPSGDIYFAPYMAGKVLRIEP